MSVDDISRLLAELEEEKLISLVKELLAKGVAPMRILEESRVGVTEVGERFARKEYFLADLVMSAEIFREVMALVGPHLPAGSGDAPATTVLLATVKGDIHDMGKNIVGAILSASGFRVEDAGVDVPPEVIVAKVKETGATIVGLSALLTTSLPWMKATIDGLIASGLRSKVKVMVGGAVVNEKVRESVGADFYGTDAVSAVRLCREIAGTGHAG